jgi:hypothetical protein
MVEPVAARVEVDLEIELAVGLEVVPPVSGNIADVDRQACLGRLAEKPDIAAENQMRELMIVSQPGGGTAVETWESEMVIVSQPET